MLDDKILPHPYTVSCGAADRQDSKRSLAYQDAPSLAPFPLTPVLVYVSLRSLRICLGCSTVLAFRVLLSAILPFTVLYRAVSASASFILWLFISWKFHVTAGNMERYRRTR